VQLRWECRPGKLPTLTHNGRWLDR
jgi:hypothetical protein